MAMSKYANSNRAITPTMRFSIGSFYSFPQRRTYRPLTTKNSTVTPI
jgi:hypothetical protein